MGKYARYSNTVDSGVEWLGYIPAEWEALPIAALLEERGETNKGMKTENVLSVLRDIGVIPYEEKGDIGNKKSDDIERYKIVHPGDLVVNSMNVIIGSVGVSAYYGSLSPIYMVLMPRRKKVIHKHFAGYVFQIKTFQRWLKRLGYGILEHRLRIPMDNLKREYLPVPSYETQEHIVAFLDHETTKIAQLIARQEQLIELLKEKRQAVISYAVTKGLNPDVLMKDSGVEWLGEVPTHWAIIKLGYFARVVNGSTPDRNNVDYWEGGSVPWLPSSTLNDYHISTSPEFISKKALLKCSVELIPRNSVLVGLVGQGKTRGLSALLTIDATINQNVAAIIPRSDRLSSKFMHLFLQSFYEPLRNFGRGSNQAALNCELVASIHVALPPRSEQDLIGRHVENRLRQLSVLERKAISAIGLMQEHRTALISAAVTGKIDVRDWKNPNNEHEETAAAVSA